MAYNADIYTFTIYCHDTLPLSLLYYSSAVMATTGSWNMGVQKLNFVQQFVIKLVHRRQLHRKCLALNMTKMCLDFGGEGGVTWINFRDSS